MDKARKPSNSKKLRTLYTKADLVTKDTTKLDILPSSKLGKP
jgi:hypothetical protein